MSRDGTMVSKDKDELHLCVKFHVHWISLTPLSRPSIFIAYFNPNFLRFDLTVLTIGIGAILAGFVDIQGPHGFKGLNGP